MTILKAKRRVAICKRIEDCGIKGKSQIHRNYYNVDN